MTTNDASPRNNFWKFLVPLLGIVLMVVGGLAFVRTQVGKNSSVATAPAPSGEASEPPQVGRTLPDFTLKQFSDGSMSPRKISALGKKVMMLNFWATWCEACMVEMPSIIKLRDGFKDKGFEVLAVNLDEQPESAIPRAVKRAGMEFPVFVDSEEALIRHFDVHAIPVSIFIDGNRKILLIHNGERDWNDAEFRSQLTRWLAG